MQSPPVPGGVLKGGVSGTDLAAEKGVRKKKKMAEEPSPPSCRHGPGPISRPAAAAGWLPQPRRGVRPPAPRARAARCHLIADAFVALGGSDLVIGDDLVNIFDHGIHRIVVEFGNLELTEFLLDVSPSPTEHKGHHAIRKRFVKS